MAIHHLKDGENFGDRPEHFPTSFGFSGSTAHPPFARGTPEHEPPTSGAHVHGPNQYAHGGSAHPHGHHVVHETHHPDGRHIEHHAHGGHTVHHTDGRVTHHHHDGSPVGHHHHEEHRAHGGYLHPHGHHVVNVEHADGMVIHHHAHGGYSIHHHDGHVTHHDAHGHIGVAPGGIEHMHDTSEYVHRRYGFHGEHPADAREDKALIAKAIHEHEDHEHDGEHTALHLRHGGPAIPRQQRIGAPHLAAPHVVHAPRVRPQPSPVNKPPRNPNLTTTPRNEMPGGTMGYGVEPSAEPDIAGSEGDGAMTTLHRGGRARRR